MDLNARVDVNCGLMDGRTDGWTENRTPISHLAQAGATKTEGKMNINLPPKGVLIHLKTHEVTSTLLIIRMPRN